MSPQWCRVITVGTVYREGGIPGCVPLFLSRAHSLILKREVLGTERAFPAFGSVLLESQVELV